jgi:hypothetical protein
LNSVLKGHEFTRAVSAITIQALASEGRFFKLTHYHPFLKSDGRKAVWLKIVRSYNDGASCALLAAEQRAQPETPPPKEPNIIRALNFACQ